MALRVLTRRFRALSGALDQVFSSLGNGAIVYAVAVVTDTRSFGQIALLMTLLAAAVGIFRGVLGIPLLLSAGKSVAEIRCEGGYAIITALLAGPAFSAVMWAVGGGQIRQTALLLMVAVPIVLVQDVLRYVVIAQGRPHVAALWDGLWCAGSLALLVATWLRLPLATTTHLIGAWVVLGTVSMLGLAGYSKARPRLPHYRAWLARDWQHRIRYGAATGLEQLNVFVVLLVVTIVLAPDAAASLRGASALLAPVAIAFSAVPLIVIPESKRSAARGPQVWSALARVNTAVSSVAVLLGVGLLLVPERIGELVLGETFSATHQVLPIVAVEYAVASWFGAVLTYLRTFNRSAEALVIKVAFVALTVAAALTAAALFRSAGGVAVGLACASTFSSTLAILWFRPWQPVRTEAICPGSADDRPTGGRPVRPLRVDMRASVQRSAPLSVSVRLAGRDEVPNTLISLWIFAALVIIGPAMIVRYTGHPTSIHWLWALPTIVIAGGRFAWLIGNGQRRLYELMFWAFTYAFLGLAPLAQLREEHFPNTVPRIEISLTAAGALIAIAGCMAFSAGAVLDNFMTRPDRRRAAPDGVAGGQLFTVDHRRLLVLAGFAIVFNIFYLSNVGWIQFTSSRDEAYRIYDAIWPAGTFGAMTRVCTYMALLVAFVALVRFRREAKVALALRYSARVQDDAEAGVDVGAKVLRTNMVLVVIVGLLLANSVNPISNARYLAGTAILAAATALGLFATVSRFRVTAVGFLFSLLVVFPAADAFRYSRSAELKFTGPVDALMSGDYDSFAQLINGYLVAVRDGIVPGKQLVGVLAFMVPRSWWAEKPVDSGIYIANARGYGFTNLSGPLWIELFLNGGWVVLIVGMFLLGCWLHRSDARLDRQFELYRMPGILGCILPFYMLILLRGSLLQAMSYLAFILLFAWFVRARAPRAPVNRTIARPQMAGSSERRSQYAHA